MGRNPIGKRAMTAAERQRRRRKRVNKEKRALVRKMEANLQREKKAETYVPYPPSITYYRYVTVTTDDGPQSVPVPTTRPLAACGNDLGDDDVIALLGQLEAIAKKRGLR